MVLLLLLAGVATSAPAAIVVLAAPTVIEISTVVSLLIAWVAVSGLASVVAVMIAPLISSLWAMRSPVVLVLIVLSTMISIVVRLLLLLKVMLMTRTQHDIAVTLKLLPDLPVDKLEKAMLVHLVIEVVRQVSALFEPRPGHLEQLSREVVPRVQHLLLVLTVVLRVRRLIQHRQVS